MNKADKELIDLRFHSTNALIMSNHDMQTMKDEKNQKFLEEILYHVKKTNGRVTELERKEAEHPLNCPQAEEVKQIKASLLEYDFLKKYPSVIYVGVGVMVFLVIISFFK